MYPDIYPEIYDFGYNRLAILSDAFEIYTESEVNTWPILHFRLSPTSKKWKYIKNENLVKYGDRWYIIKLDNLEQTEGDGSLDTKIQCPHIASELNYKYNQVLGDILPGSTELIPYTKTPQEMLPIILENSGWSVGSITVTTGPRTIGSEWETVVANLNTASEKYEGELEFDDSDILDKKVHLLKDLGIDFEENPFSLEFAKNIRGFTRVIDTQELVTRLYVFGDDDLSINDITEYNGIPRSEDELDQSYIQNFQYFISLGYSQEEIDLDVLEKGEASQFIKVGIFRDHDYIDEESLYADSKEKLDKEMSLPKFTYEINFAELTHLEDWAHETYNLGAWGHIVNLDIGIDVPVRIIRKVEYKGQPDKTELTLSNIPDSIGDLLSNSIETSGKIKKSNQMHDLLKNFISTQSITINSADGRLKWSEGQIDAIDNEDPNLRTRFTAGGIGVSKDGGQTFPNAITGEGILGEYLVVNETNVVLTDEGRSRITHLGFESYDDNDNKRVHMGQYAEKKFGLQIKDSTGNQTILDQDGLLQSWSDTIIDNVDATNRLAFRIYIPNNIISIRNVLLSFTLELFRAYSKGAASGGTTSSGPSSTTTSEDGGSISTSSGPSSTTTTLSRGTHRHIMFKHRTYNESDILELRQFDSDSRVVRIHSLNTGDLSTYESAGSHSHPMDHDHQITVGSHKHNIAHNHEIDEHTHPIEYGIYKSTKANNVSVYINQLPLLDENEELMVFNSEEVSVDITEALSIGWNLIELSSSQLGRINATYFAQVFLGV